MYPNNYMGVQMPNPYARTLRDLKEFFQRPLMLATAIVCTFQVVLTFINNVSGNGNVYANLAMSGLGDQYQAIYNSAYLSVSLLVSIVPALMCAAFWIIHLKSKNPQPTATPRAGFTILFVLCIIGIVGIALVGVILLFSMAVMSAAASRYSYGYGRAVEMTALMILLVALVVVLVVQILQLRFINSLRRTLTETELKTGGAKALGVIYIVVACILGLSMIGSFSQIVRMDGFLLTMLTDLSSIAQSAMIGAVALSYASYAKAKNQENLIAQQPMPPYAAPFAQQQGGYPQAGAPGYPQPPYNAPGYPPYQQPQEQPKETPDFEQNGMPQAQAEQMTCPVCGCNLSKEQSHCPQCGVQVK